MKWWCVWIVTYGTYDERDIPPRHIAGPISFEKARHMVEGSFDMRYCMKPSELCRH